jgi:hypothetical protein
VEIRTGLEFWFTPSDSSRGGLFAHPLILRVRDAPKPNAREFHVLTLPVPFKDAGEIHIAALEHLCDCQIKQAPLRWSCVTRPAKPPTLSRAEHDTIVRIAVKAAPGRIAVIAGAGSNSTSQAPTGYRPPRSIVCRRQAGSRCRCGTARAPLAQSLEIELRVIEQRKQLLASAHPPGPVAWRCVV